MKTVFKRLLSFVLVAMMLVSAVPFQASANTDDGEPEPQATPFAATVKYYCYEDNQWKIIAGQESLDVTIPEQGNQFINKDEFKNKVVEKEIEGYTFSKLTIDGTEPALDYATNYEISADTVFGAVYVKEAEKVSVDITVKLSGDGIEGVDTREAILSNVSSFDKDDIIECVADQLNLKNEKGVVTYVPGSMEISKNGTAVTIYYTKYNEKAVEFYVEGIDGVWQTVNTSLGKLASSSYPLEGPAKEGKVFEGWYSGGFNGSGNILNANSPASEYYAHYSSEGTGESDKVSAITVYAKLYAEDSVVERFTLIDHAVVSDGTKILEWLMGQKDEILDTLDDYGLSDFEWNDFDFYDNKTNEPLTQQDAVLNGNKYIYVKLDAEDVARVLVCVHNKLGSKGTYYKLDGYVEGTYILKSDVVDFIKSKYNVSSKNINGLYGEQEWKQLVNDEDVDGVTSYRVDNNDTTVVHVLLKDATLKGSSNNDDSNPKTGDTIMMAVTILGLSASALAVLYFLNKKKAV